MSARAKKVAAAPAEMLADSYHLKHIADVVTATREEARVAQAEERATIEARTMETIARELRRLRIRMPQGAQPTYHYGEARYHLGSLRIDINLDGDAEIRSGRWRELQRWADRIKANMTGARNFAAYCRTVRGERKIQPIPVNDLERLLADWLVFTCGPRP